MDCPSEIHIPGLEYYPNYIAPNMEIALINEIDTANVSGEWMTALSRKVKHFGYYYDYTAKGRITPTPAPPFPPLIKLLAQHLVSVGILKELPQQCIVNEYFRNQGISDHIDNIIFNEPIITISLGEDTIMNFKRDGVVAPKLLQRRSMTVLRGESRWKWSHGINKNIVYVTSDVFGNSTKVTKSLNYRRISVTFRSYK